MFYVALTFWLMVGLLQAYAIFKLWEGLVRPRWINAVLLPGTIIAEMAHFLGALLTGAPVRQAKLVSDEPVGEATDAKDIKQGIPVLSPLLTALLPILAAIAVIYVLYHSFDDHVVNEFSRPGGAASGILMQKFEWEVRSLFELPRNLLALVQKVTETLPVSRKSVTWQNWVFIYLAACISIRMVPLRGNLRSGMASIVLVGGLAALLGKLIVKVDSALHEEAWRLLSYVIAFQALLLVITLLVRGIVALVFVLADKPQPVRSAAKG